MSTVMLEEYFKKFREKIIGNQIEFETPYGKKKILYADWTASGRLYDPIEIHLKEKIFPFVGNTHTGTTLTGSIMTTAYHIALKHIKKHVHANEDDIIISSNSGMTGVINKFQRILGLKIHEKFLPFIPLEQEDKPVVFVTHMEHHSNHTTWLETIAEVEVIKPTREGFVDLNDL
ncbi:MAG: selenocysteine lyase, partial [Cyclobacteriaceae bacterium]|nr:selenocysteine lyase [Cyclobacteriaceae bacterium]